MAFKTIMGTGGKPDSFIGTAGVDRITLGRISNGVFLGAQPNNDVIRLDSDGKGAVRAFTLNGGSGNDTFSSLSSTSLSQSRIAGDEGNDDATLTGLEQSTISGGLGNDEFSSAGLIRSSLVNGNQGLDEISINAGAKSSSIFGGQGDDTFALTTELDSTLVQANEGDDVLTIAAGAVLVGSSVNGNQGNDTIRVNAVTGFSTSTIYGGEGNDTINAANSARGIVARGDGGIDNLTGGTSTDSLTGGTGNDNFTGGAGSDNFMVDAEVDAITDFGNGGADNVAVSAQATANATVVAANTVTSTSFNYGTLNATLTNALAATNVVSFALMSGTNGVNLNGAAEADGVGLIGSAQIDTITGGNGTDTITSNAGNDNLTGGADDDDFIVNAGIDDISDLGIGGDDDVVVSAGATANATVTAANTVSVTSSNAGTLNATLTNALAATNVVSFALMGGANGVNLNGTAETDGVGLIGSAQIDDITSGAGNDTITGGLGNDQVNVGTGTDQVRYAQSGAGNVDTVTSFTLGTDLVGYTAGNISNGAANQTINTIDGTDVGALGAGAFTQSAVARSAGATAAANGVDYIFLSNTTQNSFAAAIGTSTITNAGIDAGLTVNKGIAASFYDAGAGQAVFGYILNTDLVTANTLDAADTFVEISRLTIAAAAYTAANGDASLLSF